MIFRKLMKPTTTPVILRSIYKKMTLRLVTLNFISMTFICLVSLCVFLDYSKQGTSVVLYLLGTSAVITTGIAGLSLTTDKCKIFIIYCLMLSAMLNIIFSIQLAKLIPDSSPISVIFIVLSLVTVAGVAFIILVESFYVDRRITKKST